MKLPRTVYKGLNTPALAARGAVYGLETLPAWVQMPPWDEDSQPVKRTVEERIAGPAWWSGAKPPPAVGTRVNIRINGFGDGTVVAYLVEDGYLGLEVMVDVRPDWHIKNNGDRHPHPMVFGAEVSYNEPV